MTPLTAGNPLNPVGTTPNTSGPVAPSLTLSPPELGMDRRRQPPARHQPRARLVAGMSDAVIPIEHSPSATCGLIVVGAAGNINRRLGMMAGTSPRAEQFTCNARLRQRMREASSAGMPDRPSRSQSAWDRDAAARAPGIIVKTTLIKLSPSPSDTTALIQSRLSTRLVVVETPFGQQRPPRGLPAVCRPETLANPAAHRFGRPLLCRHCVRASDSSVLLGTVSSTLARQLPASEGEADDLRRRPARPARSRPPRLDRTSALQCARCRIGRLLSRRLDRSGSACALAQCHGCRSRVDRVAVTAGDRRIVYALQSGLLKADRRLPASPYAVDHQHESRRGSDCVLLRGRAWVRAAARARQRKRTDDPVDLAPVADRDPERDRLGPPKRSAIPGLASTSTLTTVSRPACRPARSSTTGEIIRHGRHHAAQKSTTTGTGALGSTSNLSASASTTHGSSDLHLGQRGNPEAIGRTRLRAAQLRRTMMAMSRG